MVNTYKKLYIRLLTITLLPVLSGCFFTGVENTGKITDKEVQRRISEIELRQPASSLTALADSLPAWRVGKNFYATDDGLRLLFDRSSDYDIDTVSFSGKTLTYAGYDIVSSISGAQTVNIKLSNGRHSFIYRTNKTLDSFGPDFSIPLLIDMDAVNDVARQLVGRDVYVKTSIWYDTNSEDVFTGRQYIPVRIIAVKPGNKVLPMKVVFTTSDELAQEAFVWISSPSATMHNRDFDSMFSLVDPRKNHPEISDAHWSLIINGKVSQEMTKEECRLALGNPMRIAPVPDQAGMREYWYYDGGTYLYFVDGLLKSFRL